MTKLINYRTYNLDRSAKLDGKATKVTPIDRGTVFGNHFIIGRHGNREEVIELYRQDFRIRIRTDPTFKERVLELAGHTLGCWCAPLPCHGDVIIKYLEDLE